MSTVRAVFVVILSLVGVGGWILMQSCSSSGNDAKPKAQSKPTTPKVEHSAMDGIGRLVEPSVFPPRSIVSLSPEATEILFFIGAGDRVVAVSERSDYPPKAKKLPKIGSFARFSPEAVMKFSPHLVVATVNGNPKDSVQWLIKNGAAVFTIKASHLLDIPETMNALIRLVFADPKLRKRAETKVYTFSSKLVELMKNKQSLGLPAGVFVQVSPPFVAGADTTLGEIIEAAGFVNAMASYGSGYVNLSPEVLMNLQLDVIFLLRPSNGKPYRDMRAQLDRMKWKGTAPRVCYLPADESSRAGPRVLAAIRAARECANSLEKAHKKQ